ncbi:MAG: hypothetical protein AABY15_00280 [Nanoarchaeota archaeon]
MNELEVKKELYKSKVMAKFSHYTSGNLYYSVQLEEGVFLFPISTVEPGPTINEDESGLSMYEQETVILSSDLGTTSFGNEVKGSELNRWIAKAIKSGDFVKIG